MEVLQSGIYGSPEEWNQVVVCQKFDEYDSDGCGAELSIAADDLVLRYFRGTHFKHHYTAICCPECAKYNRVLDVPKPVLQLVYTDENYAAATFDGFKD